ncbi:MAG: hypothetical protein AB4911_17630 [Oscillochloridaceae bacterium umkhey_bin13]
MSRLPKFLSWPGLLFLVLLLAACGGTSQPAPTSAPAPEPTAANAEAYPGPAAPSSDGTGYPGPLAGTGGTPAYPGPDQSAPPPGRAPEPIPAPSPDSAVVHGRVFDLNTNQPIYDAVMVFLSPVIATDSPDMDAVSFDALNDPSVTPDIEGGFAFANVPPGRYGVVVTGPINQYLARRSDDQTKDVIITVEAGQTLDLGIILSGYP